MGFIIAPCPHCGEEVTTEDLTQPLKLYFIIAALLAHAATVDSLLDHPDYAPVREGWNEKVESLTERLTEETTEILVFGEAYDGGEDDDEEAPSL